MASAIGATTRTATPAGDGVLPPGPRLPAILQTLLAWRYGHRFLPACRARYGDMFTLRAVRGDVSVVICRPEDIRTVFSGPPTVLHAGESHAMLGPIMGNNSIVLLDDAPHLAQRRLLLPPFHGEAVHRYTGLIEDLTVTEVASWPVGRPFALQPRMEALTLELILRAVCGVTDEAHLAQLRPRMQQMIDGASMAVVAYQYPPLQRLGLLRRYRKLVAETDGLIFDEIHRRRERAGLDDRDDVLSLMLRSGDGANAGPSDQELRDELITLVLSGYETSATTLAWAVHELVHHPELLHRAQKAADGGDEDYLGAVVKETLRLRPVIYNLGRLLTAPIEVGGYRLPAGITVVPSVGLVHHDPERYDNPGEFRPERFLGVQPPAYGWIPFGGGVRRCIGASLGLLEVRTVLRVMLREIDLAPATRRPERVKIRHITQAPARGTRVVVTARRHARSGASTELGGPTSGAL